MPIESVSRVLGHTNIVTTQIYAKITSQKLNNDLTMRVVLLQHKTTLLAGSNPVINPDEPNKPAGARGFDGFDDTEDELGISDTPSSSWGR